MTYYSFSPMGRLLLCWMAGILVTNISHPAYNLTLQVGAMCLLLVVFMFENRKPAYRQPKLTTFLLLLLPFTLSIINTQQTDERRWPSHYTHVPDSVYDATVRILEPAEEKPNTIKLCVALETYRVGDTQKKISGTMWLYVHKSDLPKNLFWPGQVLFVQLKPQPIPAPTLPGAFNYSAYAARQQVYATAFLKSTEWCFINKTPKGLAAQQVHITHTLKTILAQGITDTNALGIAEALLFGYRGDIDNNTWEAYARSGIVHVIAISGMHLGLVYTSLVFLFSWLPGKRRTAVVPAMLCLWIFAWITGMPASVMRAALMFTLLGLGQLLNRKTDTLNTLLVSALLILIVDPMQCYDIGFQLSYWAVLSLHFFYTPIYQKIQTYLPAKWAPVAQLMAATLSAQVLTTPWMLFLFHQIPLWVLLTNLIAVPWSTLLIYAELLWVFLWPWHEHVQLLGKAITHAIVALNKIAQWVGNRSDAVWQTSAWSVTEMVFLYASITAAYIGYLVRKPRYALWVLWSIAGLSATMAYEEVKAASEEACVVYYQKPQVALQVYAHQQQVLIAPTMPRAFWVYQWQPLMASLHLDSNKRLPHRIYTSNGFKALMANNKHLVYLEKPYELRQPFKVDVLVLGKQCTPGPWLNTWHAKVAICCSYKSAKTYAHHIDSVFYLKQSGAWRGFTSP